MANPRKPLKRISIRVHQLNIFIVFAIIAGGYFPFIYTIIHLGGNNCETHPKETELPCMNCTPRLSPDYVDEFKSLSLDSTQVLFVHFSGLDKWDEHPGATCILDPLNLVWVNSIEAPFLSLDLGFNVTSFTTLSRVVHHMKVKVPDSSCFKEMYRFCLIRNLASTFLYEVTKERGVLCYAVGDSNTVKYRCCKSNNDSMKTIECDIPAVGSPEMATIFTTTAIAAAIALFCFPTFFNIIPDRKNSETLCANSQVNNPLYQLVICTVQALQHYSEKYYCANVIRKLLIALALPTLYYIDYGLQWYTETFDIPKMFNDKVTKVWKESKVVSTSRQLTEKSLGLPRFQFIIVSYNTVVVMVCLIPLTENLDFLSSMSSSFRMKMQLLLEQEKDIGQVNWKEPCVWTKGYFFWLKSLFGKATDCERPFCSRLAALLGSFVLLLLSPVVIVLIFISYFGYVSPLGKLMRSFIYHAFLFMIWTYQKLFPCKIIFVFVVVTFIVIDAYMLFIIFGSIFESSLLLFTNLIVYLWMGLVASKDYYFPRIAIFSVFVYYSWHCLSSVQSRYQILLKQTFEKCKEHQEKQPNGRKALTMDDKGVPRISSELFQHVIDEILPRSEVYTKMILKLTIITLFLCLTFSSILVYGKSNLDESTKALAVFLTGLLPKLFEVFGEGSSCQQLCQMENACRVEKIVKDFLDQSDDENSDNETATNLDEEQPPPEYSDGQVRITNVRKRDQPTLEERPAPKPVHSNNRSKKPNESINGRRDKNVLVVQADVNPRVQSINSCNSDDPSTENTPLLLEHREKRDRNAIV